MSDRRIEDYAMLGDCETAALVSLDGSVDWLCWPRFDSPACFAALLGTPDNGRWRIAPADASFRSVRSYVGDGLVLETVMETDEGGIALVDFMPPHGERSDLVRIVRGLRGRVRVSFELALRFDYGITIPWVTVLPNGDHSAISGPDRVTLRSPVPLQGRNHRISGEFEVRAGETVPFVLTHSPSHLGPVEPVEALSALDRTLDFWRDWMARCTYRGPAEDVVRRSLVVLKALTYRPTGGMVAAPTTSLPEEMGGVRNWDYRYCWLRDSTFILLALTDAGFLDEAEAWRDWLIRAVAGSPDQVQIMYGVAGERSLPEMELPWLPGFGGSRPVRIGNGAVKQRQLDVFGEVADAMFQAHRRGLAAVDHGWSFARALMHHLESVYREPDEGIWEVRGAPRHFTHSKMMVWVAFDRMIRAAEARNLPAPLDRWRRIRAEIHEEVCARGYDSRLGTFVQAYGSDVVDASLLLMPIVGFLPPEDPRVRGTVAAVERLLTVDGLVRRYLPSVADDGLPGDEGTFLACSFWLVDNMLLQGRRAEAEALFERLVGLANDVGLLAEEYDVGARRMLGNFPQAFSHVALVNTALNLSRVIGPAAERAA